MIAEGILLPLNVVNQGQSVNCGDQEIWYIKACENKNVKLSFCQDALVKNMKIDRDLLIMVNRSHLHLLDGRLVYRPLNFDIFSRLLAFMDEAQNVPMVDVGNVFVDVLQFNDEDVLLKSSKAETWFITTFLFNKTSIIPLVSLLKKSECYSLVRYLLSQSINLSSLHDLGKLYGVSYSHFRRLCNHALGGKVKIELCNWRMARAILEIIEGHVDMTSIAYKYGYSSSSHFSSEVKKRLGKTPRELCKKMLSM